MAVQKIIGTLIVAFYLSFYGCGASETEPETLITNLVDTTLIDTIVTMDNDLKNNCLESIGLQMTDSVFLYWAEIATNKKDLYEHAGNRRILITQDQKFYYSRNKGVIESFDNYFNQELSFFKSLSDDNFLHLKESLVQWNVLALPPTMSNEEVLYDEGTETYLYLNLEGKKSCTKFDMGVAERIKIEEILKAIQE